MSKTNKKLEDFAELQPILKHELEIFDKEANHNKFWRCYVYNIGADYFVARAWGRNGTKGQQMVESFYSKYSALDAAGKVYEEKYRKGYRPEASPLDKIVREV
jgi:predicted DNA-binding WGR domain protein